MDIEFSSQEDLLKRVTPALNAKQEELNRLGYSYITKKDIWNYLVKEKWQKSQDLSLADIVDDILNTDNKEIDIYLKKQIGIANRSTYFTEEI